MSSALERRYRFLLSAYPDAYRDTHEEEILATLMDGAAPGQMNPTARKSIGLIVGGLRTRGRLAVEEGWAALWADGLRLAAILLLASLLSDSIRALMPMGRFVFMAMSPRDQVAAVLLAVSIVAVVAGATRVGLTAVVLVLAGFGAMPYGGPSASSYHRLAALVVAGSLIWYSLRGSKRRPWPTWLGAAVVSIAVLYGLSADEMPWGLGLVLGHRVPLSIYELVLPVALLSAIALVGNDPRPGIAAAVYALVHLAVTVLGAVLSVTHGVNVASLGHPFVPILLLGLGLTAAAAFAGTVSGRRLASEHL